MKNAVFYNGMWLCQGSKAKELYLEWKKTSSNQDRKKLDQHMKNVDAAYNAWLV